MTNSSPTCLTYFTTCDPTIGAVWPLDDCSSEACSIAHARQDIQLTLLNDFWLDLTEGRPVSLDDVPEPAAQAMQAAAHWIAQQPAHPGLAAMHAALPEEPLFMMLSPHVLWYDGSTGEWILPGLGGGLYLEGNWPTVPSFAENEDFDVAGLLAVVLEQSSDELTWVRLVLWPMSHEEFATAGSRPLSRWTALTAVNKRPASSSPQAQLHGSQD